MIDGYPNATAGPTLMLKTPKDSPLAYLDFGKKLSAAIAQIWRESREVFPDFDFEQIKITQEINNENFFSMSAKEKKTV